MRSSCKYTSGENSNTQTGPVVDELEKLRKNTEYNANTRIPTSRTTISGPKRRSKMSPAPIESLTEFNIAEYLQNLPSGLTVGQAAHLLPQYRGGMQYASRRTTSTEKEANFVESDEEEAIIAAKVNLRVKGKVQTAIVNSEAATSIITKSLLDQLGLIIPYKKTVYVFDKVCIRFFP